MYKDIGTTQPDVRNTTTVATMRLYTTLNILCTEYPSFVATEV